MNNESASEEKEATGRPPPPLKTLEDILNNRLKQKKAEMYKTYKIADREGFGQG